jgi:histidyl-tRNA synthetase
VGFALGLERLVALLEESSGDDGPALDAYLIAVGEEAGRRAPVLAERLRDALPRLRLMAHCGGGSFKSQFKKADKSGARLALILGDDELARGVAGVKPLRGDGAQAEIPLDGLAAYLTEMI